MTSLRFTVDHDHTYNDDEQLIGWVTASCGTRPGDFRVRVLGGATPRTINLPARKGYLAADGHMYEDETLAEPFRLTANDPAFNLRELTYRFDFDLTTLLGVPVQVPSCYGPAPSTDTTLYLTKLMNDVDQPVMEVRTKGYAEDVLDAGPVGIESMKATTQAAGRLAIDALGTSDPLGPVDLRLHWNDIRNGQWNTSLGATYTEGSNLLQNTVIPFTSADVGKIVIVNEAHAGPEFTRWMATIVDVSSGIAELDTEAPSSATNERISWGLDITDALNSALAELADDVHVPREAYLPGAYRMSQIVVPSLGQFNGSGWGSYSTNGIGIWTPDQSTFLKQLPGSECNFLVFTELTNINGQGWLGPVGVTNMTLEGPETNVRDKTPTIGHGMAFRNVAGDPLVAQDGCKFDWVQAIRFPENGFDIQAGAIPLTLSNFRAFYNGGYGFDYNATYLSNTQMLHLLNPTADGNTLGMARFRNAGPYGPIAITAAKSEAAADSMKLITPLGDDYQMEGFIFEECDQTPVVINGMSHIYGGSAKGPGPAIVIRSATTKRPRIAFDCVAVRVTGGEPGSVADSVTVRDEVSDVDIPHTIVSGFYPESHDVIHGIVDVIAGGHVKVSRGADIAVFNTVDRVTNYEKGVLRWLSSALEIASLYGGTGTAPREIHIGVANAADNNTIARRIQVSREIPFVSVRWNGTGNAGQIVNIGDSTGFTGSSGVQIGLGIDPVVNQTGSAGFSMLLINPTETGTGSGSKLLIDAQVGSVDKFTVDHSGNVVAAGGIKAGGTFDVVTQSVLSLTGTATLAAVDGREYTYLLGSGAVPTVPTAVGNKCVYHLKNVHTAPITVTFTGSETLDGGTGTLVLQPKDCYTIVPDQANWWIR